MLAVTDATTDVKPGTPLAADVTADPFPFLLHLFYLTRRNQILGFSATDPAVVFNTSVLVMNDEGVFADPESRLAVIWHRCYPYHCPDTLLLVYQDVNKQLRLRNGTRNGPVQYLLPASGANASGLALISSPAQDDQGLVRLFFEGNTTGVLNMMEWHSNRTSQNGWTLCKYLLAPLCTFSVAHSTVY